jgi:hypothetical protein
MRSVASSPPGTREASSLRWLRRPRSRLPSRRGARPARAAHAPGPHRRPRGAARRALDADGRRRHRARSLPARRSGVRPDPGDLLDRSSSPACPACRRARSSPRGASSPEPSSRSRRCARCATAPPRSCARWAISPRSRFPPQRIDANGAVHMDVLAAKLVEVQLRGDAGPSERLIAAHLERLTAREWFNTREAERDLLLLEDLPGYDVRLVLRSAGRAPGEVVGDVVIVRRPVEAVDRRAEPRRALDRARGRFRRAHAQRPHRPRRPHHGHRLHDVRLGRAADRQPRPRARAQRRRPAARRERAARSQQADVGGARSRPTPSPPRATCRTRCCAARTTRCSSGAGSRWSTRSSRSATRC